MSSEIIVVGATLSVLSALILLVAKAIMTTKGMTFLSGELLR